MRPSFLIPPSIPAIRRLQTAQIFARIVSES